MAKKVHAKREAKDEGEEKKWNKEKKETQKIKRVVWELFKVNVNDKVKKYVMWDKKSLQFFFIFHSMSRTFCASHVTIFDVFFHFLSR